MSGDCGVVSFAVFRDDPYMTFSGGREGVRKGFSVSHNVCSLAIKYLSVRHEILYEPASQTCVFIQKIVDIF